MLRMSAETAESRGAELMRGSVDSWRSALLADNGPLLGRAADAFSTKDCLPPKTFFDVIDGRATWRGRDETERDVKGCWQYGRTKKPSHADDTELTDDDLLIRYEKGEVVGVTVLHASQRRTAASRV
jgi:uncharacterized protein DUF2283